MIPNLPRELLWADKTDISEFMSDKLGNKIVSTFSFAKSRITTALGTSTMLKLYNEAFYISTRVVYEHDVQACSETYMEKIVDDIGSKELAEHVKLIMFIIVALQSNKTDEVLQFIDRFQKKYLPHPPFRIIKIVNKVFKPKDYRLKPCPYTADKLQEFNLDWNIITHGFSKHLVIDILDLWSNVNEKGKVIRLIENAWKSNLAMISAEESVDMADEAFFIRLKGIYNVTNDDVYKSNTLSEHEMLCQQTRDKYQNHFIMRCTNEDCKDKVFLLLEKLEKFRVEENYNNGVSDKYEFDLDKWSKKQIFAVCKEIRGCLDIGKNKFGKYLLENTNLVIDAYNPQKSIKLNTILNRI